MNDAQAVQFLNEIRKPLLSLHKAILDHERASYEREFGPVTPATFLQVLLNGSGFRWIGPLSTVIASVDETLDDPQAGAAERTTAVDAVRMLFEHDDASSVFLPRYRPLLQDSAAILHEHGRVAACLRNLKPAT
jgi:hypothetical protein